MDDFPNFHRIHTHAKHFQQQQNQQQQQQPKKKTTHRFHSIFTNNGLLALSRPTVTRWWCKTGTSEPNPIPLTEGTGEAANGTGLGLLPTVPYQGFLKWWYPQNTPKWSFLVGKLMVVGYHHLRKPPYPLPKVLLQMMFPNFPFGGRC